MLFRSWIDLCLVSTKSRVTRTFQKFGPPFFSSSGNQSFRYTIRFTSTLSFECSCVRPTSRVPYRFPILQPFRATALAYFSFRVHSVESVSWSRSYCWLGLVRVQFMCFPHRFHQFLAIDANFSHFRTVLSANLEFVRKTAITFTYELRFQRSIYQNRLEKSFGSVSPCLWRVWKFWNLQICLRPLSFHLVKFFFTFFSIFRKFHRPRLLLV